ncbi:Glycosyl hydrolases family 25 [Chryseobacterium oranimense G311]|nr:Glycosyl hydrolases family 25 [Chryseobacterium oranimense G311]
MTPKKYTKKTAQKVHGNRRKNYFFRRKVILGILILALIGTGFYLKQSVSYYYALYFNKFNHKKLHNTELETARIQKILTANLDKTYGFDVSHYQNKEDIKWDSLSIGNKTIPLEFVVMRATMGNRNADKHFDEFWVKAQKHNLIRGAYHFYRLMRIL